MPKFAVISSLDIAKCPTHCLNAQHWIGGHHIEECHADLHAKVKQYTEAQTLQVKKQTERLQYRKAQNIARYAQRLRGRKHE